MSTKDLLKAFTIPSIFLVKYLNSLTDDEKERCVVCENKEVAIVLRQIIHRGFTTKEDYRQLEEYYPPRRSN